MTIAAVADSVWLAAIGAVVALGSAWIKLSADKHAKAAALRQEAAEVVQKDIHTLVNNNMGVQLKLVMELSEWKAAMTKKEDDVISARLAREKYEDHQRKQAEVDSSKKE